MMGREVCNFLSSSRSNTTTQTDEKTHTLYSTYSSSSNMLLAHMLACQIDASPTRWYLYKLLRLSVCLSAFTLPHNT